MILDLCFCWVIFFGGIGSHGKSLNYSPSFGEYFLELFPSIEQANPRMHLCFLTCWQWPLIRAAHERDDCHHTLLAVYRRCELWFGTRKELKTIARWWFQIWLLSSPLVKIPNVQSFLLQRGPQNSTPRLWDAPHPTYTSNYQHHDCVVASENPYEPITSHCY